MPPRKEVQSLYFQCLDRVFENIYDALNEEISPAVFQRMREYYVTHLHGGIREHILKYAILKDRNRIQIFLEMINLLVDSNTNYLCAIPEPGFIIPEHYSSLISHLARRKCIGLKSLFIRVLYERDNSHTKVEDLVIRTNDKLFHSLLLRGLAKNLTVLVLGRCCDNKILKIIGANCRNLKKLDVSSSWAVDDNGFKYLCLNEPANFEDGEEGDFTPQSAASMMEKPDSALNPCCFTLTDIRIQETNTTNATVLMLLIFIKNLRTLGGFIYFRSVGDNILYLARLARALLEDTKDWSRLIEDCSHLQPKLLRLNFTELYDTHLTDDKLNQLSAVIPNLTAVYTRSIYVQPTLSKFHKLSDITIDFDFQPYEDHFYQFLSISGTQLKRINLINKNGFIDISRIFVMCPNLYEINGSVTVDDVRVEFPMTKMRKARLRIVKVSTLSWLMANAPNLEALEVDAFACHLRYMDESSAFDSRFLENLLRLRPDCLDTLKYFIVDASKDEIEYSCSYSRFKKATILKFINECKNLTLIGDLATWSVSKTKVERIRRILRRRNLALGIVYDAECQSDITMQSINEFSSM